MSELMSKISSGAYGVARGIDNYVFNGEARNHFIETLPGRSPLAMVTKQIIMTPLAFAIPEPLKYGPLIQQNKITTAFAYVAASGINMKTLIKWAEVGATVTPVIAEKVLALLQVDPHLIAPAAIAIFGALAFGSVARSILNVQQNIADKMFHKDGNETDVLNDMYHAAAIGGPSGGQSWITPGLADSVGNTLINAIP